MDFIPLEHPAIRFNFIQCLNNMPDIQDSKGTWYSFGFAGRAVYQR
jgi:hypothetical protein